MLVAILAIVLIVNESNKANDFYIELPNFTNGKIILSGDISNSSDPLLSIPVKFEQENNLKPTHTLKVGDRGTYTYLQFLNKPKCAINIHYSLSRHKYHYSLGLNFDHTHLYYYNFDLLGKIHYRIVLDKNSPIEGDFTLKEHLRYENIHYPLLDVMLINNENKSNKIYSPYNSDKQSWIRYISIPILPNRRYLFEYEYINECFEGCKDPTFTTLIEIPYKETVMNLFIRSERKEQVEVLNYYKSENSSKNWTKFSKVIKSPIVSIDDFIGFYWEIKHDEIWEGAIYIRNFKVIPLDNPPRRRRP